MAFRDADSDRIITRVVYDGLALAGKTTNLRRLCNFFTTLRRSELHTPHEEDGRTTFFDFLRLDGGFIAGHPLSCHLVTVPGQTGLARRRQFLLGEADAVVLVCDSTPTGLSHARRRLEATRRYFSTERPDTPLRLVVQANKQDLPDALDVEGVRRALDLADDVAIVPAQAMEGIGVRETAVLGIRAAVDCVQALVSARGIDSLPEGKETAERLHSRMMEEEHAAVLAGAVLELSGPTTVDADGLPEWDQLPVGTPVVRPLPRGLFSDGTTPPAVAPCDDGIEGPTLIPGAAEPGPPQQSAPAANEGVTAASSEPPAPPAPVAEESVAAVRSEPPAPPEPVLESDAVPRPAAVVEVESAPPWPDGSAASGHIWPGTTGREMLRKLERESAVRRDDLLSRRGDQDGSGRTDLVLYEVGDLCIKTSDRRRYDNVDDARIGMAHLARAKISLGALRPDPTVLALAADANGVWLWTVAPWLTTLRGALDAAHAKGDESAVADALDAYAGAAIDALALTLGRGILLDVHPSNFALQDSRVVYIDDDVELGGRTLAAGHALLQRMAEYAAYPAALERYVDTLEREITSRLGWDGAARIGLVDSLSGAVVSSVQARAAQSRLVAALSRPRTAIGSG